MTYVYLALAIVFEVIATSALSASKGLAQPIPLAIAAVGYVIAFAFLGLTLRTMPVGIAYAIWSGLGIVLLATYGWLRHGDALDIPALIGLAFILFGILIIRLHSGVSAL
jgi:small multidrug resistance pump